MGRSRGGRVLSEKSRLLERAPLLGVKLRLLGSADTLYRRFRSLCPHHPVRFMALMLLRLEVRVYRLQTGLEQFPTKPAGRLCRVIGYSGQPLFVQGILQPAGPEVLLNKFLGLRQPQRRRHPAP